MSSKKMLKLWKGHRPRNRREKFVDKMTLYKYVPMPFGDRRGASNEVSSEGASTCRIPKINSALFVCGELSGAWLHKWVGLCALNISADFRDTATLLVLACVTPKWFWSRECL